MTDSQEHKEDTQLQSELHLVWSDALDQLKWASYSIALFIAQATHSYKHEWAFGCAL